MQPSFSRMCALPITNLIFAFKEVMKLKKYIFVCIIYTIFEIVEIRDCYYFGQKLEKIHSRFSESAGNRDWYFLNVAPLVCKMSHNNASDFQCF